MAFATALSLLLLASSALALPKSPTVFRGTARHNPNLARRVSVRAALNESAVHTPEKRDFSNARWTFFAPGLGACGKTNGDGDFIVALNIEQWDGGSHCFEEITMSYGGKTTTAQITDQCPGCPFGGLDLSPGLFDFFASEALGVIQGEWSFGSGGGSGGSGGGGGATSSSKQPAPSSKAPPPPPATSSQRKTSSSAQPEPETSSTQQQRTSSTHSASASASSSTPSASPTSASAAPVPSSSLYSAVQDPNDGGNLAALNNAFVQFGGLVMASS